MESVFITKVGGRNSISKNIPSQLLTKKNSITSPRESIKEVVRDETVVVPQKTKLNIIMRKKRSQTTLTNLKTKESIKPKIVPDLKSSEMAERLRQYPLSKDELLDYISRCVISQPEAE